MSRRCHFSLAHTLVAVVLIAILLALVISESRGRVNSTICSLAFSQDGREILVVRCDDRSVFQPKSGRTELSSRIQIDCSRTISIIDAQTGSTREVVERSTLSGYNCAIREMNRSAAFGLSPDTILIQEFGGGETVLYDRASGESRALVVPREKDRPTLLGINRARRLLLAGDKNGMILCDAISGERSLFIAARSHCPRPATPIIAWSADGDLIASEGCGVIDVWRTVDGAKLEPIRGLPSKQTFGAVAFSPTNRTIAVEARGRIYFYNFDLEVSWDIPSKCTSLMEFLPDGNRLLVATAGQNEVLVVDASTGRTMINLQVPGITAMAVSPDGKCAVIGDWEGRVTLWDLASYGAPKTITVPGIASRHLWR
jgi:WD40 repeat protein